jgi:tetratricopeptide (TPR) repeat protein
MLAATSSWRRFLRTALCGILAALAAVALAQDRAQAPLSQVAPATRPAAPATEAALSDAPEIHGLWEKASAAYDDGKVDLAFRTVEEALGRATADYFELRLLAARCLARLGRGDNALVFVESALAIRPASADANVVHGLLMGQRGRFDDAAASFRAATLAGRNEPNNPAVTLAWYQLGQCLAESGRFLAAAQAFAEFDRSIWEDNPEHRNAREIVGLLSRNPRGALEMRIDLLRRVQQAAEIVAAAESAARRWPDDAHITQLLIRALLDADRPADAFAASRAQLARGSDGDDFLDAAVQSAIKAGKLDAWVDELRDEPPDANRRPRIARALNRHDQPAAVLRLAAAWSKAAAARNGDLLWEIADAQRRQGAVSECVATLAEAFRGGAELSPSALESWTAGMRDRADLCAKFSALADAPAGDAAERFAVGLCAAACGESAVAERMIAASLTLTPDFGPGITLRGRMQLARFAWDEAKRDAQASLKLNPDSATAQFLLAEAHDGLDENEEAEAAYRKAIRLRPGHCEFLLALGRHYLRLGSHVSAQRYFAEAAAADPRSIEAHDGLIDAYLRDSKHELANDHLRRMETDAAPPEAVRRAAIAVRHMGNMLNPQHLAELQTLFEQQPDDRATARVLAAGLLISGDVDASMNVVRRMLAVAPHDYHAQALLSRIHQRRIEFDKAVDVLEQLARQYPNRVEVLEPLAQNLLFDCRPDAARGIFRRLADLARSRKQEALGFEVAIVESHLRFREYDQGFALLDKLIAASPRDPMLPEYRLRALLECGRIKEALELAAAALTAAPDDTAARNLWLSLAIAAKETDAAIAKIREWTKPDNKSATPALTEKLIDALIAGNRADEALREAKAAPDETPETDVVRRIWMMRCFAALGKAELAIEEFDALLKVIRGRNEDDGAWDELLKALRQAKAYDAGIAQANRWLDSLNNPNPLARIVVLDRKRQLLQAAGRDSEYLDVMVQIYDAAPDNVGVANDLGYTWIDRGENLDKAFAMVRRAVTAEPLNPAYLDSLGWGYYKRGDIENAVKYLSRAVRLRDGDDPVLHDHLGDALLLAGQPDAAAEQWRISVELIDKEPPERATISRPALRAAVSEKLAALKRGEKPAVASRPGQP